MAKMLRLVNGIPRMVDESGSPTIYNEELLVVSGTPGAGQIQGPITTGDPVTLPSGKTYDSDELEVYLNGQRIDEVLDYNYNGIVPRTQVTFTFDIIVGDVIRFRIDRGV